jgi:thioredoxin 1
MMKSWQTMALAAVAAVAVVGVLGVVLRFSVATPGTGTGGLAANPNKIALTQDNFQREVLDSDLPVVVDFHAEWCAPCREMAPLMSELAVDFRGVAKIGTLDVDRHEAVVDRYNVSGVPTLLFFRDGEVVDEVIGLAPKQVIAGKLQSVIEMSP